ncbi:MAG: hypothetical protein JXR95_11320 [Deltaproteobacteria bacterium]|nr:hypothetical protein [Deltaproteobacteria bacterium]
MKKLATLSLMLGVAAATVLSGCYIGDAGTYPATTSANYSYGGYTPYYYAGNLVYFDTYGRPYYYNGSTVYYVPRTWSYYGRATYGYRHNRYAYNRWYSRYRPGTRYYNSYYRNRRYHARRSGHMRRGYTRRHTGRRHSVRRVRHRRRY